METASLKITLIGAGRLATHLALALQANNWKITDIYSRNLDNAIILASQIHTAKATNSLDFSESKANLFIIAVSDNVIEYVVETSTFPTNAYVIHTSGSMPLKILHKSNLKSGIFYPLQTFSLDKVVDFSEIPIFIETEDTQLREKLLYLAHSLSKSVMELDAIRRKQLHLAAVFACNFTNYLFGISEEILNKVNIPQKILKPLVLETVLKSFEISPKKAQTGPAHRGDTQVINSQLELLTNSPEYRSIYKVLTEGIIEQKKAL